MDNLINRASLIEKITDNPCHYATQDEAYRTPIEEIVNYYYDYILYLNELIHDEPEVPYPAGVWIHKPSYFLCPYCAGDMTYPSNYCPKCGTRLYETEQEYKETIHDN